MIWPRRSRAGQVRALSKGEAMSDRSPRSAHWLRTYDRRFTKPDLVAGLTAAAVVLPKGLAYATIAGLPVEVGLYTSFAPMVIYALLGSSRLLSVSTTTTIAILTAGALGRVAPDGGHAELIAATATLSLLVGAMRPSADAVRIAIVVVVLTLRSRDEPSSA